MLAAHGLAVSIRSHRRRPLGRRLPALVAVALVAFVALVLAPTAGARPHHVSRPHPVAHGHPPFAPPFHPRAPFLHTTYLALGDSLAFGYSQAKFNELFPAEPASAYDTGYVDDFGHVLALFQPGVQTVNDGCPGETTDSFIAGPCTYGLRFPLHHPYSGAQLADALSVIAARPNKVSPITIDIGANDALGVTEGLCKLEAKCVAENAPTLFAHIAGNLGSILTKLRAAAPHARMIVLGLYNPFGESIAGSDALTAKLNEVMAGVAATVGARFADPLPFFNPPGALEQPTLCALTNICTPLHDVHPTDLGYAVLGGLVLGQYLRF